MTEEKTRVMRVLDMLKEEQNELVRVLDMSRLDRAVNQLVQRTRIGSIHWEEFRGHSRGGGVWASLNKPWHYQVRVEFFSHRPGSRLYSKVMAGPGLFLSVKAHWEPVPEWNLESKLLWFPWYAPDLDDCPPFSRREWESVATDLLFCKLETAVTKAIQKLEPSETDRCSRFLDELFPQN
jgi:hypothetical protein